MACYDFPLVVIHEKNGTCPRYNGGICHPLPTPTAPYTDEERAAVEGYMDFLDGKVKITRIFHAGGSTLGPMRGGDA
jgi:hypothetical protein